MYRPFFIIKLLCYNCAIYAFEGTNVPFVKIKKTEINQPSYFLFGVPEEANAVLRMGYARSLSKMKFEHTCSNDYLESTSSNIISTRPFSSILIVLTLTLSPILTTSSTFSTLSFESLEM